MTSIKVTIRSSGEQGSEPEVIEHPVVDSLSSLVSGLDSVRSQTNAALTKHVEVFRQGKGGDGKQEDLENDYMEQDPEDEDNSNEAPNNKKAKQN